MLGAPAMLIPSLRMCRQFLAQWLDIERIGKGRDVHGKRWSRSFNISSARAAHCEIERLTAFSRLVPGCRLITTTPQKY